MIQQQLALDAADDARRPPSQDAAADGLLPPSHDAAPSLARPSMADREALMRFLEEVARRVAEAAREGAAPQASTTSRLRLRNTVRNAQLIAARARRAIDALPRTDLELLRANGRLLAAIRDALTAQEPARSRNLRHALSGVGGRHRTGSAA